jgi:hypothetical protein
MRTWKFCVQFQLLGDMSFDVISVLNVICYLRQISVVQAIRTTARSCEYAVHNYRAI